VPGTPKKRERLERERLDGVVTQPGNSQVAFKSRGHQLKKVYEVIVDIVDGEEVPRIVSREKKTHPGQSPEFMARIRAIRDAKIAAGDDSARPGPAKKKYTRAEITERALERLEPKALKVLEEQIKNEALDPSDRRAAAIKILEYRRGKPTQAIKVDQNQVTTIRFETAAWVPGMAQASSASIETGETLELPPGDVVELDDAE